MMKKSFLAVLAAVGFFTVSAHAATNVSLVGALNYGLKSNSGTEPLTGATFETKGALGYGGGLLLNFGSGNTTFELGAIYFSKGVKTTATLAGVTNEETLRAASVQIPVMVRFGGNTSFGIGGFYELSLETGGGSDYGLIAGPRFNLGKALFADARYAYGLKEGNTSNAMLLIGYKFGGK